jgi:ActR/RegA family two-component response regulator
MCGRWIGNFTGPQGLQELAAMDVPRALVVDDEPAILRTLPANLAARGYAVTAAIGSL